VRYIKNCSQPLRNCGKRRQSAAYRSALRNPIYIWIHSGATVDNGPLRGERVRRSRGGGCLLRAKSANPSPIPHAGSPLSQNPPPPAGGGGLLHTDIPPSHQKNNPRSPAKSRALIQAPPRSPDQIIVNCFSELR